MPRPVAGSLSVRVGRALPGGFVHGFTPQILIEHLLCAQPYAGCWVGGGGARRARLLLTLPAWDRLTDTGGGQVSCEERAVAVVTRARRRGAQGVSQGHEWPALWG